jgi:predicted nucleic acid-binding protein
VTTVLDSWAILRHLEGIEPAASAVDAVLEHERPIMSWINLGEVFYVLRRAHGEEEAMLTVRDIRDVISAELPTTDRVLEAARIKSDHRMSYADAFLAATAIAHDAVLWTGDEELLLTDAAWKWKDLRG